MSVYQMGDMNADGTLDNFDIQPFELALTSRELYAAAYGVSPLLRGDVNEDGAFDNFDIQAFEAILTSGAMRMSPEAMGASGAESVTAVPEPSTLVLGMFALAALAVARRRARR